MVDVTQTLVTVMVTPTASSHCPYQVLHREGRYYVYEIVTAFEMLI
jgi:hypothetical protein